MTREAALREAFRRVRREVWTARQTVLEAAMQPRGDDWGGYG